METTQVNKLQELIQARLSEKLGPMIERTVIDALVGSIIDGAIESALANVLGTPVQAPQNVVSIRQNLDDDFGVTATPKPRRGRPPGSRNRATIEREAQKAAEAALMAEARGGVNMTRDEGRNIGKHAPVNGSHAPKQNAYVAPAKQAPKPVMEQVKAQVQPSAGILKKLDELDRLKAQLEQQEQQARESTYGQQGTLVDAAAYLQELRDNNPGMDFSWIRPRDIITGPQGGRKTKARPEILKDWEWNRPVYMSALMNRWKWAIQQERTAALG